MPLNSLAERPTHYACDTCGGVFPMTHAHTCAKKEGKLMELPQLSPDDIGNELASKIAERHAITYQVGAEIRCGVVLIVEEERAKRLEPHPGTTCWKCTAQATLMDPVCDKHAASKHETQEA